MFAWDGFSNLKIKNVSLRQCILGCLSESLGGGSCLCASGYHWAVDGVELLALNWLR